VGMVHKDSKKKKKNKRDLDARSAGTRPGPLRRWLLRRVRLPCGARHRPSSKGAARLYPTSYAWSCRRLRARWY